ncbi:hypothetical protein JCM10450v2_007972 [Rhodotorula kratochvilovae]
MPPLPPFAAPSGAQIRIPTFLSPTAKRSPTRAPQNRDEERAARLKTTGGAEDGASSVTASQAPVAPEPEKKRRKSEKDKAKRRSTRGGQAAREADEDAPPAPPAAAPGPVAATSTAPAAPVTPAPTKRAPRLPRAAARSSTAAPAPAPASQLEEEAGERRLSGTRDAPSLAGKGYRRDSKEGAEPVLSAKGKGRESLAKATTAVEKGKGRAEEPALEKEEVNTKGPRRRSKAAPTSAADVTEDAPPAVPALAPAKKAPWRSSARPAASTAGTKKRPAAEPEPADEQPAPAAVAPPAKKRRQTTVVQPAPGPDVVEDVEEEVVTTAVPVPTKKARASTAGARKKGGKAAAVPADKPAERPRPASPPSSSPPSPPVPRAGPSRLRNAPQSPSPTDSASSSPPPAVKGTNKTPATKKDAPAGKTKQIRIATLRTRGNAGALNALDVVLGGSVRVLARAVDDTDDPRARKVLKAAHGRVQRALLSRSMLLSSHTRASKALAAAKARAKKLRGELLEVQRARGEVGRELAERERAWEREEREAAAVKETHGFLGALARASVHWR